MKTDTNTYVWLGLVMFVFCVSLCSHDNTSEVSDKAYKSATQKLDKGDADKLNSLETFEIEKRVNPKQFK